MIEVIGEKVRRQMNERFGELVLGPPRLQRPLPGGVLDVANIGRSLSDHCDERSEFVVEIDVATSDGNRFFRAKSGVCSGDGVRGLAVVAGIDGAHREGDGFAGARIERPEFGDRRGDTRVRREDDR